jgi:hypothetical protein
MSVSGSEEAFMKMEKDFEKIQSLCEAEANGTEERYATELLSIRFKEYFEEHVSETEMESVLDAYKNVLFLSFVSGTAKVDDEADPRSFPKDEDVNIRLGLLVELSDAQLKIQEAKVVFDEMMMPFYKLIFPDKITDKMIKKRRRLYLLKNIRRNAHDIRVQSKRFSIKELESILKVLQRPEVSHVLKVRLDATAYALKEYLSHIAASYDYRQIKKAFGK